MVLLLLPPRCRLRAPFCKEKRASEGVVGETPLISPPCESKRNIAHISLCVRRFLSDDSGSFSLHDSVEDCDEICPAGTYSDGVTATGTCFVCPAGTYLEDDATSAALHDSVEDCDVCPAGT